MNEDYSADDPQVHCCSRGNRQKLVVRQNKGPVSLVTTGIQHLNGTYVHYVLTAAAHHKNVRILQM
jgi:hypothetical protein